MQAQSAKLIGEAIQNNPAFLSLRKIEVRTSPHLAAERRCTCGVLSADMVLHSQLQAAREIANTIAQSQNRVFLNSDSLLLNLVSFS